MASHVTKTRSRHDRDEDHKAKGKGEVPRGEEAVWPRTMGVRFERGDEPADILVNSRLALAGFWA
jgi:hypothetical protein